ncbi:coat protein [Veillonella montpellierensis DNF00314]|uniref:Coat protein n=1 Tax=Veillonella montpellierensis DNF00314 TaxID=1401067 RepID=A0A096BZA1_9FIRM|nr:major capsid protein [Veillonella montpellierensis]KGF48082.1 coat protein [Veillonella montpellierensis DNF00314]
MGTTLQDIINPTPFFTDYVVNRTEELSSIFQSGILTRDSQFDQLASEPAQVHNMPFFNDLTGDSEDIIEGQDLTADKITSNQDTSTTIRRAKMWSSTDLAAQLSGTDPMKAIGDLAAGFWARDHQKELLNILDGVFSSTSMTGHVLNITDGVGKAANFSGEAFIDAMQLMGDARNSLTAVVMHSATRSYLDKLNLIQTIRQSDAVSFDTYMGRRVIVDDGCPVDTDKYTTYLFGEGAIAYGVGNPVGLKQAAVDRDEKKGSGIDYLIMRKAFILHPRGVAWQNKVRAHVESVSRDELKDSKNWKRVYDPKKIRIVKFVHKLG